EDFLFVGTGEVGEGGKAFEKTLEERDGRGNLGLLEHDLTHPDAVGISVLPPGQVALVLGIPVKQARRQPASKRTWHLAWRSGGHESALQEGTEIRSGAAWSSSPASVPRHSGCPRSARVWPVAAPAWPVLAGRLHPPLSGPSCRRRWCLRGPR